MSLRVMATSMQAREEANCIAMFGNEGILMSGSRPPEFKYRKFFPKPKRIWLYCRGSDHGLSLLFLKSYRVF